MFRPVWYCWNRDHEHSTEQEAEWCTDLFERWQEALFYLDELTREAEVEYAVARALAEAIGDEDDA